MNWKSIVINSVNSYCSSPFIYDENLIYLKEFQDNGNNTLVKLRISDKKIIDSVKVQSNFFVRYENYLFYNSGSFIKCLNMDNFEITDFFTSQSYKKYHDNTTCKLQINDGKVYFDDYQSDSENTGMIMNLIEIDINTKQQRILYSKHYPNEINYYGEIARIRCLKLWKDANDHLILTYLDQIQNKDIEKTFHLVSFNIILNDTVSSFKYTDLSICPSFYVYRNNMIVVLKEDIDSVLQYTISCYDSSDGNFRWKYLIGSTREVVRGLSYRESNNSILVSGYRGIYEINVESGIEMNSYQLSPEYWLNNMFLIDNEAYFYIDDKRLISLDLESGCIKRQFILDGKDEKYTSYITFVDDFSKFYACSNQNILEIIVKK